ncbi:MAG TPA: hypothetical protein VFM18_23125 [Methanosarcina sp.]|nr:hypothetical protein [Methanosarcina sp.]
MEDVVSCITRGVTSPTLIAKQLGIPRTAVLALMDQWKAIVADDKAIKARAREALASADQQYNDLIKSAWSIVDEADAEMELNGPDPRMMGQKNSALKNIADFEAKRFGMLKDMGMMDDASTASEYAEIERKNELVMNILRDVTMHCDRCRMEVADRISQITGEVHPVRVIREDG